MSTSAVWKLEHENSFPTNCFPARGVARRLHEGAGSWLVAYAEEQQDRFEASFKPTKHVHIQESDVSDLETIGETRDKKLQDEEVNTLNENFLVQRHHVESVLDLCSVNVSDRNLEHVSEDDLKKFVNVAYVNAAENLLPFRPFNQFISLRELELPVNGLRNLQVEYGDFPNLQVLDLSYNNLSTNDVLALGILDKLKVLTLTGNGLHSIHADMARPEIMQITGKEAEVVPRFRSLEVLLLDDNHLADLSTFASLAALPQLRELNLDKNGIEVIPHLKVVGDRVVSETHSSFSHRKSETPGGRRSRSSRKSTSAKTSKPPPTEESQPDPSKRNMATSTTFLQQDRFEERVIGTEPALQTPDIPLEMSESNPPFQQLRLLSIAHNRIREEECVLAVAAWPHLRHLVMHGNPIVKNNSGDPPLISHYLKQRLGIHIHRFQPKAPLSKPHLVMPIEKDRKVTTFVPKIPKQPVDILLKSLMGPSQLQPQPPKCPPPSPDKRTIVETKKERKEGNEPEESIFLTQIDELPVPQSKQKIKRISTKEKAREKQAKTPTTDELRYKGYEILLDAKQDSSLHEPLGIQGNVRALHHALSHPTVFRTTDVTLDQVLPCYHPKSSRHNNAMAVARERGKQKRPTKKQQLEGALEQIRKRDVVDVEMPLSDALNISSENISTDEAECLFMEVEEKYRVVREESLRASRQAQRAFQEAKEQVNKLQR